MTPEIQITIVLKTCECGCGQLLKPKTIGKFINNEHRLLYHNERRRKTDRRRIKHA